MKRENKDEKETQIFAFLFFSLVKDNNNTSRNAVSKQYLQWWVHRIICSYDFKIEFREELALVLCLEGWVPQVGMGKKRNPRL